MRKTFLYAALLTSLLLAVSIGTALAQAPDGDRAQERRERMQALHAARNESLAQFHENRTAAIADFRAAHNETKRSFLENRSRVIDECRAARNETEEDDDSAHAKCVSDGLRPLITQAREEHAAQREAFRARMLEARRAAIQSFLEAREEIRASRGS